MNRSLCFLLLALIIATVACRQDVKNDNVIYINPSKRSDKTIDDFIDRIELIPLEFDQNALLKSVSKVVEYNDLLLVQDRTWNLFVFDNKGKFIRQIGSIGRAPGEYVYLADFQINTFTGNIELMDCFGKISVYKPNGEFISYYGDRFQEVSYFYIIDEDLIMYSHSTFTPSIDIYSRACDSVIRSFFSFPDDYGIFRPVRTDAHFYRNGNRLMIHEGYTNNIYEYLNGELVIDSKIDLGPYSFSVENYDWSSSESRDDELRKFINKKYAYGFFNDFENSRYLIKKMNFEDDILEVVYDKMLKTVDVIPFIKDAHSYILDDIRAYSDYLRNGMADAKENGFRIPSILNWDSGDDYILTAIRANDKHKYINPDILDDSNLRIYDNMALNDNPVLVKIFFKNN